MMTGFAFMFVCLAIAAIIVVLLMAVVLIFRAPSPSGDAILFPGTDDAPPTRFRIYTGSHESAEDAINSRIVPRLFDCYQVSALTAMRPPGAPEGVWDVTVNYQKVEVIDHIEPTKAG